MKKLVLLSAMLALVFSFNAKAFEINPYASGKVNFNFHKTENIKDNVLGGSIAVGISGAESLPVRAEFEFSMAGEAEEDYVSIKANSYMANFYYDFYNSSSFVPYAGFGLGASTIKIDDGEGDYNETEFSWQLGLGSYYKITESLLADLGVKYNQTSVSSGNLDVDTKVTTISLGLRYNF